MKLRHFLGAFIPLVRSFGVPADLTLGRRTLDGERRPSSRRASEGSDNLMFNPLESSSRSAPFDMEAAPRQTMGPSFDINGVDTVNSPLRCMLFIDGTWLYYSMFERGSRCQIKPILGHDWRDTHRINWGALPRVISHAIEAELLEVQRIKR